MTCCRTTSTSTWPRCRWAAYSEAPPAPGEPRSILGSSTSACAPSTKVTRFPPLDERAFTVRSPCSTMFPTTPRADDRVRPQRDRPPNPHPHTGRGSLAAPIRSIGRCPGECAGASSAAVAPSLDDTWDVDAELFPQRRQTSKVQPLPGWPRSQSLRRLQRWSLRLPHRCHRDRRHHRRRLVRGSRRYHRDRR